MQNECAPNPPLPLSETSAGWTKKLSLGFYCQVYLLGVLLAISQSGKLHFPKWVIVILLFAVPVLLLLSSWLITVREPGIDIEQYPLARRFVRFVPPLSMTLYFTGYFCREYAILMILAYILFSLYKLAVVYYGTCLARRIPDDTLTLAGTILVWGYAFWWVLNQVASDSVKQNLFGKTGIVILVHLWVITTIGVDLLLMYWCQKIARSLRSISADAESTFMGKAPEYPDTNRDTE